MNIGQIKALQPILAEQQLKQKCSKSCLFNQERCGRIGTMGNLVLNEQPDPAAMKVRQTQIDPTCCHVLLKPCPCAGSWEMGLNFG